MFIPEQSIKLSPKWYIKRLDWDKDRATESA